MNTHYDKCNKHVKNEEVIELKKLLYSINYDIDINYTLPKYTYYFFNTKKLKELKEKRKNENFNPIDYSIQYKETYLKSTYFLL
jgi:hypothetical protein